MPNGIISTKGAVKIAAPAQNRKKFSAPSAPRLVFDVFSMSKTDVFIFFRAAKKNLSVTQDPESKPGALIKNHCFFRDYLH